MNNNANLHLTEKAIARHTKRLQKELSALNHKLKLSEAQNMLSRIFGMNDYHELKKIFHFENKITTHDNTSLNESDSLKIENVNTFIANTFIQLQQEQHTLDFVQKNLENFVRNGEFQLFVEYYNSENHEIMNYLKDNAFELLKVAIKNNQDLITYFILDNKLVALETLSEADADSIMSIAVSDNINVFEHIFYDLLFPEKVNKVLCSKWIHYITESGDVPNLKRFLEDKRISFQKDFFWNKLQGDLDKIFNCCALNTACLKGHFPMVKYLIEVENLKPLKNGSTVQQACRSGNLDLVKYLIEVIKANYIYFEKNNLSQLNKIVRNKLINSLLDNSTLSSALLSNNIEVFKYLIHNHKMDIAEHDFLALRTALIDNCQDYIYLLVFSQCRDYLKSHAQEIFDSIISRPNLLKTNKSIYQQRQFEIVQYLFENYTVEIKEINYSTNNLKLIQYLKTLVK